jgi:hypothetical protein
LSIVAFFKIFTDNYENNIVPKSFRSFQHTMKFLIIITYYSGTDEAPAPCSINDDNNNNVNEGGNNQNEILFNLGNQFIKVVSYSNGLCFHPILILILIMGASRVVSEEPTY